MKDIKKTYFIVIILGIVNILFALFDRNWHSLIGWSGFVFFGSILGGFIKKFGV